MIKPMIFGAVSGAVGALTLEHIGSEVTLYNASLCGMLGLCVVYSVYCLLKGKA